MPSETRHSWLPETWQDKDGQPLACREKILVLAETLTELQDAAQDAFEDGLLIGCSETQLRAVLQQMLTQLENPYTDQRAAS